MFQVTGNDVYISRGDTASFQFAFWGHPPQDGTVVRFTVKLDPEKIKPVICKDYTVHNGFITICFESADTKRLPAGDYVWDIRILWGREDPNTPVSPLPFHVLEVVGDV